jgi:hypothetical protein
MSKMAKLFKAQKAGKTEPKTTVLKNLLKQLA